VAVQIIIGDALEQLRLLPSESVHCVVTSPPYYGLRDYNVAGQIGLEPSPGEYVARLVEVFSEVRRVLRADGTVWLNLGDSYVSNGRYASDRSKYVGDLAKYAITNPRPAARASGIKPKDLIGIPWMLAFALRDDGWYLRQDIIWAKPNPLPESVTDRCTKAHEYVFLLSKSARYYYDADAIAEPFTYSGDCRMQTAYAKAVGTSVGSVYRQPVNRPGRNKRSVWTVASEPYAEAHFATYPPALIEPCVLAGTSERGVCAACGAPWVRQVKDSGVDRSRNLKIATEKSLAGVNEAHRLNGKDYVHARVATDLWQPSCACDAATVPATVLDPFAGAGTTGLVADRLGRNAVLIELNPAYAALARTRIESDAPLFAQVREPVRNAMPMQEMLL